MSGWLKSRNTLHRELDETKAKYAALRRDFAVLALQDSILMGRDVDDEFLAELEFVETVEDVTTTTTTRSYTRPDVPAGYSPPRLK